MSKLSEILSNARARLGPELSQRLDYEIQSASADAYDKLITEGWTGRSASSVGRAPGVMDISEREGPDVVNPPEGIESDPRLHEGIWENNGIEPEELYGVVDVEPTFDYTPLETPTIAPPTIEPPSGQPGIEPEM